MSALAPSLKAGRFTSLPKIGGGNSVGAEFPFLSLQLITFSGTAPLS